MGIFTKIFGSASEVAIASAVERVLEDKLRDTIRDFANVGNLTEVIHTLKQQRAMLADEIAREKLDLKHKLGLERMRQEQDAEIAKERLQAQREAIEGERDLAVQAARFEAKAEALEETQEQLSKFTDRQEKMIESLLGALPTAELFKTVGE